ncbi:uncharacterized protein [Manis javanica]|uniref:uncharacterized protein n=1 Tax=Manis javanica TaxID=9974 RepID=UPI003C6D23A6
MLWHYYTEWNPSPSRPRAEVWRGGAAGSPAPRALGPAPQQQAKCRCLLHAGPRLAATARRAVEGIRHPKAPGKQKRSPGGEPGCEKKNSPARPPPRPHPATLPVAASAAPWDHWPRGPSVRGGRCRGEGSHWALAETPKSDGCVVAAGAAATVFQLVASRIPPGEDPFAAPCMLRSAGCDRRSALPSRLRSGTGGVQMLMGPRSARLRLPLGARALAAPTSPPSLGSPPHARWDHGAASRLSRGGGGRRSPWPKRSRW